jgi:hypothetical protein
MLVVLVKDCITQTRQVILFPISCINDYGDKFVLLIRVLRVKAVAPLVHFHVTRDPNLLNWLMS